GYIPVTKTGFEYMKANGFYDKAPYKGRETAIASLSIPGDPGDPGGIRLGGFIQIRGGGSNALQEIFSGKASGPDARYNGVSRGNAILRRFEQTYKDVALP